MDKIIALLGTSTISVIITAIFNWVQNRKRNSLNYIADERKKRKKVFQEIIMGIKQSVYKGTGKENIEQYLDKLEMNINPYGKHKKWNYAKDGHIWEVIGEIRNAKDEKNFEQKKELLINYLYLTKKADWEQVKKEVKGYSTTIIYVVLIGIILILYAILYLVVFKLDDIRVLGLMLIFNCFPLVLVSFFIVDDGEGNNKKMTIDAIIKTKRKKVRSCVIVSVCFLLGFFISYSVSMLVYPRMILKEMQYILKEEELYIYTELNTNYWYDLELDIEKQLNYDVIMGKSDDSLKLEDFERTKEIDDKIEEALRLSMNLFTCVSVLLIGFEMIIGISFFLDLDLASKGLEREIKRVKYNTGNDNNEKCRQLELIVKKIEFSQNIKQEHNKNYLGLLFRMLEDLDEELRTEVSEKEKNAHNVEGYENIIKINLCREEIKRTIKEIRKVHRCRRKTIQNVSPNLKNNIQQISKSILQM